MGACARHDVAVLPCEAAQAAAAVERAVGELLAVGDRRQRGQRRFGQCGRLRDVNRHVGLRRQVVGGLRRRDLHHAAIALRHGGERVVRVDQLALRVIQLRAGHGLELAGVGVIGGDAGDVDGRLRLADGDLHRLAGAQVVLRLGCGDGHALLSALRHVREGVAGVDKLAFRVVQLRAGHGLLLAGVGVCGGHAGDVDDRLCLVHVDGDGSGQINGGVVVVDRVVGRVNHVVGHVAAGIRLIIRLLPCEASVIVLGMAQHAVAEGLSVGDVARGGPLDLRRRSLFHVQGVVLLQQLVAVVVVVSVLGRVDQRVFVLAHARLHVAALPVERAVVVGQLHVAQAVAIGHVVQRRPLNLRCRGLRDGHGARLRGGSVVGRVRALQLPAGDRHGLVLAHVGGLYGGGGVIQLQLHVVAAHQTLQRPVQLAQRNVGLARVGKRSDLLRHDGQRLGADGHLGLHRRVFDGIPLREALEIGVGTIRRLLKRERQVDDLVLARILAVAQLARADELHALCVFRVFLVQLRHDFQIRQRHRVRSVVCAVHSGTCHRQRAGLNLQIVDFRITGVVAHALQLGRIEADIEYPPLPIAIDRIAVGGVDRLLEVHALHERHAVQRNDEGLILRVVGGGACERIGKDDCRAGDGLRPNGDVV